MKFLRTIGRCLPVDGGWVFGWPGSGFACAFHGRGLSVRTRGSNAWVELQGLGRTQVREILEDEDRIWLAGPFPEPRTVFLSVRKRTEASVGLLWIRDAEILDGNWLEPPPAPPRRVEFLGDSITCAYGCLEPEPTAPFRASTEDFGCSWASVAGSRLDAEVHAIAWSGIGVVRNWPGVQMPPLPEFWKQAVPGMEGDFDLSSWQPQAVVVNLGSNDFGVLPFLGEGEFAEGFRRWMVEVRLHRPEAPVLVVDGPLLRNDHPAPGTLDLVRELLDRAVDSLGGTRAGFHRMALPTVGPREDLGADYHPSAAFQERMGILLCGVLEPWLRGSFRAASGAAFS